MSKKARVARPRREKKEEKAARRPRRAPSKVTKPAKPAEVVPERERGPAERYLIAIRIDGMPGVKPPQESTLNALRMKTRFSAVLLRDNPATRGMLRRVKDHVTWGDANKEDLKLLLSNRADTEDGLGIDAKFVKEKTKFASLSELLSEVYSGEFAIEKLWQAGIKPVFRLHPPRGGFRRSSKRPFADSGELGYREDGLHDLLTKMC